MSTDPTGEAGNPNGESEQGLAGDMGVSSERTIDPDNAGGIEGTGTTGTARGRTHGTADARADEEHPAEDSHRQVQDREANPDEVRSHDEVRAANPRPTRQDD